MKMLRISLLILLFISASPARAVSVLAITTVFASDDAIQIAWNSVGEATYRVEVNGREFTTTSSTSTLIPRLNRCTVYSIFITATNPFGDLVGIGLTEARTTDGAPTVLVLNTNLTSGVVVERNAIFSVRLAPGFRFSALDSTYRFRAFTGTSCNYENARITKTTVPESLEKTVSETKAYTIYPNPARDNLKVTLPEHITSGKIYDSKGRLISSRNALPDSELEFNLEGIHPGIYHLHLYSDDGIIYYEKIIIN